MNVKCKLKGPVNQYNTFNWLGNWQPEVVKNQAYVKPTQIQRIVIEGENHAPLSKYVIDDKSEATGPKPIRFFKPNHSARSSTSPPADRTPINKTFTVGPQMHNQHQQQPFYHNQHQHNHQQYQQQQPTAYNFYPNNPTKISFL